VRRAALAGMTVLACTALVPPTAAQSRAAGSVVRFAGADSHPVAGARVVLHRVGRDRQGPIDSLLTDRSGRFRFTFPTDTTALHLLTARHAGVQYFSEPVGTDPFRPDTGIVVAVYDTSSSQPIMLDARHLVVSAPAEDGSRSVVELVSVANRGEATRVPASGAAAVWAMRLPAGAFGFAAGDGDLSAGAVERRGDSVVVVAPIAPGERQLAMEYLLPPGIAELGIPFPEAAPLVNVLLEEPDARVGAPSLEPADSGAVIQGRDFRRWSGSMQAGTTLRITFGSQRAPGAVALAALVSAVGLGLALATALAWRRPRGVAAPPAAPTVDALIGALADLDHRYAGRRAALADAEWGDYERRRAELKRRLTDALADRRTET